MTVTVAWIALVTAILIGALIKYLEHRLNHPKAQESPVKHNPIYPTQVFSYIEYLGMNNDFRHREYRLAYRAFSSLSDEGQRALLATAQKIHQLYLNLPHENDLIKPYREILEQALQLEKEAKARRARSMPDSGDAYLAKLLAEKEINQINDSL